MTKYSLETKLAAVLQYLEGKETSRKVAQAHNVNRWMLEKWTARFQKHGMEAFQGTYTNYPVEFKLDVLRYIEETGASIEEAASVFNIPSSSTIGSWKRAFETKGIDALQPKTKGRPSMKKDKKKKQPEEGSQEALLAEIERLRMENAYLKKLNALVQEERRSQSAKKRR